MTVVELVAKLGLKVDEGDFQKGAAAIGGVKAGLAALGLTVGAVRAGLEAIIASTAAYGNAAAKSAQRIGVSVEAFQEIVEAADDVQVSAGSVEAGLRFLGRNAYEASKGGKEAAASFRSLGVALLDENGKLRGTDALLMDLADRFSVMPDGPEKTALAMKVLGRGGTEMIPLLNKGSAALAEMREGARETGLVLSKEGVQASVEYTEALDELEDAITGLKRSIGVSFMKDSTSLMKTMAAWVAENRKLIATKVQAFVEGFSAAMKRLRQLTEPYVKMLGAIVSNSMVWKGLLIALGTVALAQFGSAVAGVVASLGTMLTAVRAITAAQVIGAAASLAAGLLWAAGIAIIALVIEDLYTMMEGGESLASDWTKWLDRMLKIDPADSPLLKGLKGLLQVIFDIQGALQKLERSLDSSRVGAAVAGAMATVNYVGYGVAAPFSSGASKLRDENWRAMGYYGGQAFLDDRGKQGWGWNAEFDRASNARFLAAPAPAAGVAPVSVTFGDVNVGPVQGGTVEDLKSAFGDVVEEKLQQILNPAWEAAPLAGGGG
jgi:hypothetical protein